MLLLVLGLGLFLGVHSVSIVANRWRDAMVARMGENAWKGLYSLVSMVGLGLVVFGYAVARRSPVFLWWPPFGLRHGVLALMLPFFPLLFAAYMPGRISDAVKNPMLLAVGLWAASHLLVNGALHDLALFGAFLVWAALDLLSLRWRPVRPVPGAPRGRWNDLICVVGGLGLYAVTLLFFHKWLIGVAPLG
jgi:uncharacterized membrane protein